MTVGVKFGRTQTGRDLGQGKQAMAICGRRALQFAHGMAARRGDMQEGTVRDRKGLVDAYKA